MLTKKLYEQATGRSQKSNVIAYQIRQSFRPGEITAEEANQVGYELASRFLKGKHAFIVATHTDREHIHNHIIFCAVNFVDHHKYNSNKRTYYNIRNTSDRLCRENGLSVVAPSENKGKHYAEYQADKAGKSWKSKLKIAVDALIPQVSSFEELLQRLQASGYEIKRGKYIN